MGAAAKTRKDFDVGSERDLEKAGKLADGIFARVSNSDYKEVTHSLRDLDEPTTIDEGPPGS